MEDKIIKTTPARFSLEEDDEWEVVHVLTSYAEVVRKNTIFGQTTGEPVSAAAKPATVKPRVKALPEQSIEPEGSFGESVDPQYKGKAWYRSGRGQLALRRG